MAVERTLAILKPDCVRKNLIGEVIRRMQEAGFRVCALKNNRSHVASGSETMVS